MVLNLYETSRIQAVVDQTHHQRKKHRIVFTTYGFKAKIHIFG